MASRFDLLVSDVQQAIDSFNKDPDIQKKPFVNVSTAVQTGVTDFVSADQSFRSGDTMGGSAAVMRGIGSLSSALALMGPAGAAAGLLMATITSIIAAILDAMKPATDSLESKLEKIIVAEDLRNAYSNLVGGKQALLHAMQEIDNQAQKRKEAKLALAGGNLTEEERAQKQKEAAGMTYPELTALLDPIAGWKDHEIRITECFDKLGASKQYHTKEWLPLFDITITYALRYWLVIESMAGLIDTARDGGDFRKQRRITADNFKTNISNQYFSSQNEVDFYHIKMGVSAQANPYDTSERAASALYNTLSHRIGVVEAGTADSFGGEAATFAVASSGTIFAGGTGSRLYFGRGGEWKKAENSPACDQVFIGEMPDDKLIVVCVHSNGSKFSVCAFDDAAGTANEQIPGAWTPDTWRWGTWRTWDVPGKHTILSMAVQPQPPDFALWAFALTASGGANLFSVRTPDGNEAVMTPVDETWLTPQALSEATYGVAPQPGRWEISPSAITCLGDTLYVQAGNKVMVRDAGRWVTWDLQDKSFFWDDKLQCYQVRAYADGTLLCATNKGLYMRWTGLENETRVATDKSIETLWFAKKVSRQAAAVKELYGRVKAASDEGTSGGQTK